jgi:hypothetical protein
MDIIEFLQQSSGKWFSHRSVSDGSLKQPKTTKTDVQVDWLDSTDPAVVDLCGQREADPAQAIGGLRATWATIPDLHQKEKRAGSTLMVAIAQPDTPNSGTLLHDRSDTVSCYRFGQDDALTLVSQTGDRSTEERIWFGSPNLRLRSIIVNDGNGNTFSSFCSEIRMGGARPEPPAEP